MIISEDCDRQDMLHALGETRNANNIESPRRETTWETKIKINLIETSCDMKWFITEFTTTTMTR
jgi:hypothetical protein